MRVRPGLLWAFFIGGIAVAQDHHPEAHVHGHWEMFAAQDGDRLSLTLKGPIVDVLGFESTPQTTAQHDTITDVSKQLENLDFMLTIDPRAGCSLLEAATLQWPEGFQNDHDHHSHDHAHGDNDDHANDLEIMYNLQCKTVDSLSIIRFIGFSVFPAITQVEAVFLGDKGQHANRLLPDTPNLIIR